MAFALALKSRNKKAAPAVRAARRGPARTPLAIPALPEAGAFVLGTARGARPTTPTLQTRLEVGEPDDRFEREADRVAEEVVRMPTAPATVSTAAYRADRTPRSIQRLCSACEEELHRQAGENEEEEELLQTKLPSCEGPMLTPEIASWIGTAMTGGGQPLPAPVRTYFEPRFGHDFTRVRIHKGAAASRSARLINAQAYTLRQHIVFGEGQYAPETSAGRKLLAHELAHTIQQGATPPATGLSMAPALKSNARPAMSSAPVIQRACRSTPPPADLDCPTEANFPGPETSVLFGIDDTGIKLPPGSLSKIAAAWHAGGGLSVLRVDGFTSCDGRPERNWRISCDAALAAAAELQAHSPKVPNSHVRIFAHGETDQFSSNAMSNRRVVITSDGVPAPGGACSLRVTGPSEVDHYCAAYMPSDASACGVFPAPDITLTAVNLARGATPAWSIVRGGAMASIAGVNTKASVAVHGDAASQNPDDVAVQVTDGTCTKLHALTVREPSEMTAVQARYAPTRTEVRTLMTYTVLDQFKEPMGADICIDETMTLCFASHPANERFGDSPTNPDGQVEDLLAFRNPGGIPADLCRKFDQVMTAGGCGPLLHNTIVYQAGGITLNPNDSCTAPGSCP